YAEAVPGAEFAFIAVATPEGENGEADLRYVERAACSIAQNLDGPLVVINKSTVPIGTGDIVSHVIKSFNTQFPVDVVSNPEFLREGSALRDFMQPDRVVIGAHNHEAAEKVARLYEPLTAPVLIYNLYTAEMVKYASNAFLCPHLVHERDRPHLRARGRRRQAGRRGHGAGQADRFRLPGCRYRLWRLLLPQGRQGPGRHRGAVRVPPGASQRGDGHQPRSAHARRRQIARVPG